MRIRNGFEGFFCLRSNLGNDNIISAWWLGLKTGMDFRGLVWKRVWKMTFFGLKSGQDLESRGGTRSRRQAVSRSTPRGSIYLIGSLSNDAGRRQLKRQKSSRFIVEKQKLRTCITLFCTFLCRHCTTTTWKCLISGFFKDGNLRQQLSFSFPELWYSHLEFNSKKFANIWRIKRDGINAIKFEATWIQFLSDVFVAVAVVVVYWSGTHNQERLTSMLSHHGVFTDQFISRTVLARILNIF